MGDFMGRGLTAAQTADIALAATAAQKAANLSDLASASTSRTNLGLGTMATQSASSATITGGTSAAIPSKTTVFSYPLTASVFGAVGLGATTNSGSSAALVHTATARYVQTDTGTTANAGAGGYSTSSAPFTTSQPWTAFFRFRTGSTLANQGLWIGITSALASFSGTAPAANSLLARYRNGTDTQLVATGRAAGAGVDGAAFGPVLAPDTAYMMRIRFDGTTAYFSAYAGEDIAGNFGTEVPMTTLPVATTGLGWMCQGGNIVGGAGTSSSFAWSLFQVVF